MGDMLSQAEIDALLNGDGSSGDVAGGAGPATANGLSQQEIDALTEISNICMTAAAGTLSTLTGKKASITSPAIEVAGWKSMADGFSASFGQENCVAAKIEYTGGFSGMNFLMLRENDVKIITDLMMGGEGKNSGDALGDLHISAIGEAMNQMIGSSVTSMSSMFSGKIEMTPPAAAVVNFGSGKTEELFGEQESVVKVGFKLEVEGLIDSQIIQLLPISFAKTLVQRLLGSEAAGGAKPDTQQEHSGIQPGAGTTAPQPGAVNGQAGDMGQAAGDGDYQQTTYSNAPRARQPVNVQPAQFQAFDDTRVPVEKSNLNIIMDVPLQVTVELGRTQKLIKHILEFGQGTIIELDKLAGEPVDILVNGKFIAKGEVVVIDESFGVRITDIVHPSKRL